MDSVSIDPAFWAGKRVLVTGHTGFKGSWLSLWLHAMGAIVTGFALPPTGSSLFEMAGVEKDVLTIMGDIRDAAFLQSVVKDQRPDIVFHLAAQPLVRESYADPVTTYQTNIMGTVHLLEAIRSCNVRVVVNVTSDKCYENRDWEWGYREIEPMGGDDPYSSSKACAELVTAAYRRSFLAGPEAPVLASARAGNVIGGGDWAPHRLVPDLMRAAFTGKQALIRSPHAVRPWQHVLACLGGYLVLAQALATGRERGGAWNFGPRDEDAKTVGWVVERVSSSWHAGLSWSFDERPHPAEAHSLRLDCSKARSRLGWRPHWDVEDAIDQTVDWYSECHANADMRRVTIAQIEAYMGAASKT